MVWVVRRKYCYSLNDSEAEFPTSGLFAGAVVGFELRRDGQLPFSPFERRTQDDDEAGGVIDVQEKVAGGQEAVVGEAAEREARVGMIAHDLELIPFDFERGAAVGEGFAKFLVHGPLLGHGGADGGRPGRALRTVEVVALQVLGELHQAGRGAEVEAEGVAVGVEIIARIHEGAAHAEVRAIDLVAHHLVGVQQGAGAQFSTFRDDAVDNLFDADRIAMAHSRFVIRFARRRRLLADVDGDRREALQCFLRYFLVHVI